MCPARCLRGHQARTNERRPGLRGKRRCRPSWWLEFFNPIGPGMPTYLALGDFARQIAGLHASSGVLRTGNIHVFRDFIDIEHVTKALWVLAQILMRVEW